MPGVPAACGCDADGDSTGLPLWALAALLLLPRRRQRSLSGN
ncbi:MAG: MYXO-CTERM sorting domain-containing protein [Deltaproteobacteria bacterium]|nr:MYXO-CTERM sorting domain-containing protein [Deltaproteobacteria bacterium]